MLERYAVDPELSSLLRGMAAADAKGQAFYGENVPRPKLIRLSIPKGVAVVDDCQDSSQAGIEDAKTHKHLTIGVSRNHVVVTMHRSTQGWRVAFVSYSRTKC
jgi:hypothetical protein